MRESSFDIVGGGGRVGRILVAFAEETPFGLIKIVRSSILFKEWGHGTISGLNAMRVGLYRSF